jgi:hypothetical protein
MDDPKKQCVDLMASGYEWTCLECETLNTEIEAKEKVKCKECGAEFETYPPEHAYE